MDGIVPACLFDWLVSYSFVQLKFRLTQTLQPLFSLFVFWLTLQMEMEKIQSFCTRWLDINTYFKCVVNWTVKGCSHGIANRFCYLARSVHDKKSPFQHDEIITLFDLPFNHTYNNQQLGHFVPFPMQKQTFTPHDQDPSKAVKCVVNWTIKGCSHGIANRFCYLAKSVHDKTSPFQHDEIITLFDLPFNHTYNTVNS